jgi:phosphatidylserine/phosphatidylglycerophosphate/cardiolipin synthase-like enzyme
MELNEENLLGIAENRFASAVEEGLNADFANSKEIRLEEWRKRPLHQRLFERVAKVLIEQY